MTTAKTSGYINTMFYRVAVQGDVFIHHTHCIYWWLKIKYPTRQYAISPQPVV